VLLRLEVGRLGASPAVSASEGPFIWLLFCAMPVWFPKLGSEIASSCLYVPFVISSDRTNPFFVLLKRQIFATQLLLMYWSSWGQTGILSSQKQEENENPYYIYLRILQFLRKKKGHV